MIRLNSGSGLRIDIERPGEGYRGSRFDWTGKIRQITLKETTFCTDESLDPSAPGSGGSGLFNEFGIDDPAGYAECPAGGQFHKIGTGFLTRDSEAPYDFFRPYKVEPVDISVSADENSCTFRVKAPSINGYAYSLTKNITLEGMGFSIEYELGNTGEKRISTNEYVHNFLSVNRRAMDSSYVLKFPFPLHPENFGENVNPEGVVTIGTDSFKFKGPLNRQIFFSNCGPGKCAASSWMLENRAESAGISETLDSGTLRINVWGNIHVISPELFTSINIVPGENARWRRDYRIYEI